MYLRKDISMTDNQTPNNDFANQNQLASMESAPAEQPQEIEAPIQEPVENDTQEVAQQTNERSNETHISALREKASRVDQAERERNELLQYIETLKQQPAPEPQQAQQEDDLGFEDDTYLEGRHLKKIYSQINKMQKKQDESLRRLVKQQEDDRLMRELPDVQQVLTPENVASLKAKFPHLISPINNSTVSDFEKIKASYSLVKELGIYKTAQKNYIDDRIDKNSQKPRPAASIAHQKSDSPLSRAHAFAHGFDDEAKRLLAKEMDDAMGRKL